MDIDKALLYDIEDEDDLIALLKIDAICEKAAFPNGRWEKIYNYDEDADALD